MEVKQQTEFFNVDDKNFKITLIEPEFNDNGLLENNFIILTKMTIDNFLKLDNPAELIALYTFYYYTVKWQKTNQIKCTTGYVSKGLKWHNKKVQKYKKILMSLGLINDVIKRDSFGKIKGYYIKMNYVIKNTTINTNINQSVDLLPTDKNNPQANMPTNALSDNILNALSDNNINTVNKKGNIIKEIIDYLNLKALKHFTYKNDNYNRNISGRIKQGFTVADFKKVIDLKCNDNWFKENKKFLNPDTLFCQKNFEKYLNENIETIEKPVIDYSDMPDTAGKAMWEL